MNTESQVLNVPIEDIIPNRFQPRLNFDENGLEELAASIKEHGIIQPLVLRRLEDKYEIIAGERRYKAAKLAGLTSVPAIITQMDDQKSAEVAIVENVQRRDLSSIEEAKSYKALLDKGYLTQEELAKKMGLSQSAISNKLRLLTLSENVQNALMDGKISERHARSLLQLESFEEQDKWLKTIIDDRLTVRDLDSKLKELNKSLDIKPDIDEIKKNAKDIADSINELIATENKNKQVEPTIPNKFFNFLEDEEANMSTTEIESSDDEESTNETIDDEIELLDFLVSPEQEESDDNGASAEITIPESPILEENTIQEETTKDYNMANDLVNKLVKDLNDNNYKVILDKSENSEEIKYIVTIDKKEEN